jgi:hypothetical protein
MTTYARGTSVSTTASRVEIERTLKRFGVSDILCLEWRGKAAVVFEFQGKRIRLTADLPTEVRTPKGRRPLHPEKALEQETRERWRALLVSIKGSMSAVEAGIKSFEQAFIGDILLPDGKTVSEWALPQVERAYESGRMPPLLFLPGMTQKIIEE